MEELILNETTRSDRKWAWTKRNIARADDVRSAMDELRRWWPMTARQIYYRLISSDAVKQDHWRWKGRQVDIYTALGRTLKWMRIDDKLPWNSIIDDHRDHIQNGLYRYKGLFRLRDGQFPVRI